MARTYGQYGGVTTALELVGERWALLIVRDLLVGPRRYTDLRQGLPRIPTNILSTRLKELQQAGVVRRAHLAHCGLVYELTAHGRSLEEAVLALGRWGFTALGEPEPGDVITQDSLTIDFRSAFRPAVAAGLPATAYEVRVGGITLALEVTADGLRVSPLGAVRPVDAGRGPLGPPDLVLAGGPAIRRVLTGEVDPAAALDAGIIEVLTGDPGLVARFASTFRVDPRPHAGTAELIPTLA